MKGSKIQDRNEAFALHRAINDEGGGLAIWFHNNIGGHDLHRCKLYIVLGESFIPGEDSLISSPLVIYKKEQTAMITYFINVAALDQFLPGESSVPAHEGVHLGGPVG